MNNKIELYNEAMAWAYQICKANGRVGGHEDHIWVSLVMGKFSELLISSCIKLLDDNQYNDWQINYLSGWQDAKNLIKTHFTDPM